MSGEESYDDDIFLDEHGIGSPAALFRSFERGAAERNPLDADTPTDTAEDLSERLSSAADTVVTSNLSGPSATTAGAATATTTAPPTTVPAIPPEPPIVPPTVEDAATIITRNFLAFHTRPKMAFILNPYSAPLDLSDKKGISLYHQGIEELGTKYDGQGKNLTVFLSQLQVRAQMCHWANILQIPTLATAVGVAGATGYVAPTTLDLLKEHGQIVLSDVEATAIERAALITRAEARTGDDKGKLTDGNEARLVLNAHMLFECIESSLTATFRKSLATKLPTYNHDGVKLLYDIIKLTYTTTVLATRDLKLDLQSLDMKNHGYSLQKLHTHVDVVLAQIKQSGADVADDDIITFLFQAYKTNPNKKWNSHVDALESDWSRGKLTESSELRTQGESFAQVMIRNGEWKAGKPTEQLTALTGNAKNKNNRSRNNNSKTESSNNYSKNNQGDTDSKKKPGHPDWKFDENLGSNGVLKKNDRVYYWCTGPGHNERAMWCAHKAGTCSKAGQPDRGGGNSSSQAHASSNSGEWTHVGRASSKMSKSDFRAHVTQQLEASNSFNDDVSEIVNNIVNQAYK